MKPSLPPTRASLSAAHTSPRLAPPSATTAVRDRWSSRATTRMPSAASSSTYTPAIISPRSCPASASWKPTRPFPTSTRAATSSSSTPASTPSPRNSASRSLRALRPARSTAFTPRPRAKSPTPATSTLTRTRRTRRSAPPWPTSGPPAATRCAPRPKRSSGRSAWSTPSSATTCLPACWTRNSSAKTRPRCTRHRPAVASDPGTATSKTRRAGPQDNFHHLSFFVAASNLGCASADFARLYHDLDIPSTLVGPRGDGSRAHFAGSEPRWDGLCGGVYHKLRSPMNTAETNRRPRG